MPVEFVKPTLLGTTTQSRINPQGPDPRGLQSIQQLPSIIQRAQGMQLQADRLALAKDQFMLQQTNAALLNKARQNEQQFNLLKYQMTQQKTALDYGVMPKDQEAYNAAMTKIQQEYDNSDHSIDATSKFSSDSQKVILKYADSHRNFTQLQQNMNDWDKMSVANKVTYDYNSFQNDMNTGVVKDLSAYTDTGLLDSQRQATKDALNSKIESDKLKLETSQIELDSLKRSNDIQKEMYDSTVGTITDDMTAEQKLEIYKEYTNNLSSVTAKPTERGERIRYLMDNEGMSMSEAIIAEKGHKPFKKNSNTGSDSNDLDGLGLNDNTKQDKNGKTTHIKFPDGTYDTVSKQINKLPKGAVELEINGRRYIKVNHSLSSGDRKKLVNVGLIPPNSGFGFITDEVDNAPGVIKASDGKLLIPLFKDKSSEKTLPSTEGVTPGTGEKLY